MSDEQHNRYIAWAFLVLDILRARLLALITAMTHFTTLRTDQRVVFRTAQPGTILNIYSGGRQLNEFQS